MKNDFMMVAIRIETLAATIGDKAPAVLDLLELIEMADEQTRKKVGDVLRQQAARPSRTRVGFGNY